MRRPLGLSAESILAFAIALLILLEPGRVPLFEPDEGRYAEIPREMLASGDFVVPHLNGVLYLEKPPLHYWLVAGSLALFGDSEMAVRLPVKAATLLTMLALALFAGRRFSPRVGALAATFFGGSLLGFALARLNIIDPVLTAAQTLSILAFASLADAVDRADERRIRLSSGLLAAAAAAAVLLKGLVGIVLPGGAILVWTLVSRDTGPLLRLFRPLPVLVFLGLSVPWHVAAALREPDFLRFYFVHEHVDRFLKPGHKRPGPPWYFLGVLVAGFLPWTLLAPRLRSTWPGFRRERAARRPLELLLWIWVLLVVTFFSISKSKLVPYVEPVFPALALLLAMAVGSDPKGAELRRGERAGMVAVFSLLAIGSTGFALGRFLDIPGLVPVALVLSAAALLAAAAAFALPRVSPRHGLAGAGAAWALFLAAALAALPTVARWHTAWPIVEQIRSQPSPGSFHLVQRGDYLQTIPFYAGRLTPLSWIGRESELEFGRQRDHSGLFQTDEQFARLWNGRERVLAVVHGDILERWEGDTELKPYRLLARGREGRFVLLSNREGGPVAAAAVVAGAAGKAGRITGGDPPPQ